VIKAVTVLNLVGFENNGKLHAKWQVFKPPSLEQLRRLLIRLSGDWPHYRVFDWQEDVPWTNNGTEQIIGRMKMRSRTVRGFKTKSGILAGLMIAGSGVG
jgi:hypothetical protein